jgi:thioredoxin-like negative regulator of GroEL
VTRAPVFALLVALACVRAEAAPFVPTDDAQVLERLPFKATDPGMSELMLLRAQLAQQPESLPLAVELARRYLELGRVSGDPRYAGYAQAALAPWWALRAPPRDVLIMRATLRQRVHEFDAALVDLGIAIERNPHDAQARLTRATVLQVRGDFDGARRDCEALHTATREIIWAACLASVDASSGRLRESYRWLRDLLVQSRETQPGIQVWLLTGLAEMAARAGMLREANAHFRSALAADPDDQYLLAAYADFLLDTGRPDAAARLTKERTQADGLLLRYALALQALGSSETAGRVDELRARFAASRLRGDRVHLKEEARFVLHLEHRAAQALELARANWVVQKEPSDARVLLEAALAAGDTPVARSLAAWLKSSRLEDVRLEVLLPKRNPGA